MPLVTPLGTTLAHVFEALQRLSLLGRLQAMILVFNIVTTIVVLNVASGEVKNGVNEAVLYFSLEFAVFTVIGIVFTITVENLYAFAGLILLQVQLAAFTTASAVLGDLREQQPWVSWGVVAVNWSSITAFLALQRVVRRTWGWHAYHLVGSNPENVALYDRYQQFCAALIADVFHAVFFVTVEELVVRPKQLWQPILVYSTGVVTVISAKVLQICVRQEKLFGVIIVTVYDVLVLGVYMYFAVANTIADSPSAGRVDVESAASTAGQRHLVVVVEWCVVAVRLITLVTIIRSASIIGRGIAQFFPRGTADDSTYLINPADAIAAQDAQREARAPLRGSVLGSEAGDVADCSRLTLPSGTGIQRYGAAGEGAVGGVSGSGKLPASFGNFRVIDATSNYGRRPATPTTPAPSAISGGVSARLDSARRAAVRFVSSMNRSSSDTSLAQLKEADS